MSWTVARVATAPRQVRSGGWPGICFGCDWVETAVSGLKLRALVFSLQSSVLSTQDPGPTIQER